MKTTNQVMYLKYYKSRKHLLIYKNYSSPVKCVLHLISNVIAIDIAVGYQNKSLGELTNSTSTSILQGCVVSLTPTLVWITTWT